MIPPDATLHFDVELLERLRDKGVTFTHVTLHVGAGTFLVLYSKEAGEKKKLSEKTAAPAVRPPLPTG